MSAKPETPSRRFTARVAENRPVGKDHRLLKLTPLSETHSPRPGQFYMLGTGRALEPLLKRPFCFFSGEGNIVHLLYRVRGKGTAILADTREGAELEVLGPLGNGYPMPPAGKTPVVAAGGTAVASVFPLVQALKGKATVIYGAKDRDGLVMLDELRAHSGALHVRTDDGSTGKPGNVLDALREINPGGNHVLYVCGPREMLSGAVRMASERGVAGYASLEEYMACGVGACMGCVVKTIKGYRRVCREGPVFKFSELTP